MMFDDDYEIDDLACPACGNSVTHSDHCQNCDEMNEVSICIDDLCQDHCIHGDGMVACPECNGTGIRRWCPKCGADYWRARDARRRQLDDPNSEYNKKVLADLRQRHPTMTAEEMVRERKTAMARIRESMREQGHEVPSEDWELLAMMKEAGALR